MHKTKTTPFLELPSYFPNGFLRSGGEAKHIQCLCQWNLAKRSMLPQEITNNESSLLSLIYGIVEFRMSVMHICICSCFLIKLLCYAEYTVY